MENKVLQFAIKHRDDVDSDRKTKEYREGFNTGQWTNDLSWRAKITSKIHEFDEKKGRTNGQDPLYLFYIMVQTVLDELLTQKAVDA